MWPVTIAVGIYYVCKGIQEAMDENREKNHQLTYQPKRQLNKGQFNAGSNPAVSDCYEEIESQVCDERY